MDEPRDTATNRGASAAADRSREADLTPQQVTDAENRLLVRRNELRTDIQRELVKYDGDRYALLADRVADTGDAAVADLFADVDLGEIDRDVGELRDVEAALSRIADGSYGRCVDCGEPIGAARLESLPQAQRDLPCQQRYERLHGGTATPSL